MKRKSTRRDFLKGRSAADAVSDAVHEAVDAAFPGDQAPPAAQRPPVAGGFLVHVSRRAMACQFEVRVNAGQYPHDTESALAALDLVDTLEEQMSIFRDTSQLCHINRTASQGPVEVEARLFELLEMAMQLYAETDGAFDLTSAALWEVWGFARRAAAVPTEEQLAEALGRVGGHLVRLDAQRRTIQLDKPGVQLNLGSIGKGYALDRCADLLLQAGIEDFLFHGGNSSVLARGAQFMTKGCLPKDRSQGWIVGVRHPLRPDRRLAEIRLCDRALATSGSWAQSFVHRGRRYGHIIDPRTGHPAEGVLSATAIAPTAALADALSTAFYVLGPDKTVEYCEKRPEIAALLACPVRHSGGVEIRSVGFAEAEIKLLG
ncbi:MAG: FAD:protein FMN transferase [Pirellulales bacterium]|nr:FAD:protein FMN transferase [Pirellulales bacterium]